MSRPVLASLFTTTFFALLSESLASPKVVLDPGHGGSQPGTYWGGVKEKDLTLPLAKKVKALLEKAGIEAVLTRTRDVDVSLLNRAAIANRFPDAIFVSLHFNGSTDTSIAGIETYYYGDNGKPLAEAIQKELAGRIKTKDRGIKQKKELAVLNKTKAPAALVECGFLSNTWERNRCVQDWFQQALAEEIAAGIKNYLQTVSKQTLAKK